jgi:dihydroneopterin aldolase/2-amino-4-hydroxy-6-hydroxymethyldihydropteridine diphosphokinase
VTSPVRAVDLDVAPREPADVVLALGANLGDPAATLRSAVADLRGVEGLDLVATSPVFETDPVGGPEQPVYLNAVVLGRTTLSPRALLHACQRVEAGHGRERTVRWGARTLDVDVIAYADLVTRDRELTLPHPRAHERAFVLAPWAALAPSAVLPDRPAEPVGGLAAAAPDAAGVRPRPDVVLEEARS